MPLRIVDIVEGLRTAPDAQLLGGSLAILVALFVSARSLRRWLRGPADWPRVEHFPLTVYEIACLSGGRVAVLKSALAKLLHERVLALHARRDGGDSSLFLSRPLSASADPLEQAVCSAVAENPGESLHETFPGVFNPRFADAWLAALSPHFAGLSERLVHEFKLLLSESKNRLAVGLPLMLHLSGVVALLMLLNAAHIIEPGGPRQDVGTLLFLAVLLSLLFSFIALGPARLTQRGERLLARLRSTYAPLRTPAHQWPQHSSREVALAVGLFGLIVLHGTPLADLLIAFHSPAEESSSGEWN